MNKQELRTFYLAEREKIEERERLVRTETLCKHLLKFILEFKNCSQLFLFYSIGKEPAVEMLSTQLWGQINLALPCILSKEEMVFRKWDQDTVLEKKSFQLKEPPSSSELLQADAKTVVLVPNLAMDQYGYRLGYGRGYYDNFLVKHPSVYSIGVNFSEFYVKKVPRDSWDFKLKLMCTEKGFVKVLTEP